MLINAQRPEELRIAIVRDHTLENFQVDVAESGLTRGNIYRGTIVNIQPSLNAAFIDYGTERHGFLAIQDVVAEAYYHAPRGGLPRIDEVLERGKPIVVQVARDAIGQKGASLTTSLSLAGRYLVLTPFDDTRGVSRKVEEEETRKKLKSLVGNLELPPGCGVIVRTNALDQNKTAISRDLAALLRLWKRVQAAALSGKGSRLLYSDQDLIVQSLRDHLDSSIEEVLVDDDAAFHKAQAYVEAFLPRAKIRVERYADRLPLFSRFELEPQIDRIYERRVELPSGGSIVIDATEALTAVDVNSGRSTRAATQEETAVHTNLEAASEVARQLRLRDLGGLVVVDFIDMRASKNQRRVEKAMRDAMKADKARSSVGRISSNGLLEINRQRIQQALEVRTHRPCPTCGGTGRLASPEMVTLNLLRRIEARAASGLVQGVRISLHPELADAMQNSRRQELAELEREFDLDIEVIAAAGLHRPEEQIEWTKRERAAAARARTKPAIAPLQPWDLALAADQEAGAAGADFRADDDEDEEQDGHTAYDEDTEHDQDTAGDDRKRSAASDRRHPEGSRQAESHAAGRSPARTPFGRRHAAAPAPVEGPTRQRGGGRGRAGGPERRGRKTAAGLAAPAAAGRDQAQAGDRQPGPAAPAGGEEDPRRGRKRRRGGRKHKRANGPNDEAQAASEGHAAGGIGGSGGTDDANDAYDASNATTDARSAVGASVGAAGPAGVKRSRRRRRRRGSGGLAGAAGDPGGDSAGESGAVDAGSPPAPDRDRSYQKEAPPQEHRPDHDFETS
jgi:ribonuclease E